MSRGDLMRVLCLIAPLLCVGFAVHAGEAPVDWQTDRRLTNEPGASELSINFARPIAADEHNGVHIVWHNSLNGKTQVYYMRSVNGGTTWNARRRLSQSPHENQFRRLLFRERMSTWCGSKMTTTVFIFTSGNPPIWELRGYHPFDCLRAAHRPILRSPLRDRTFTWCGVKIDMETQKFTHDPPATGG